MHSLQPSDTIESSEGPNTQVLSPETQAELQRLSTTLQNVHLQQRRMSNFTFEPVSLPVSRVSGCLPYHAAYLYRTVHPCHAFVLITGFSIFYGMKRLPVWLQDLPSKLYLSIFAMPLVYTPTSMPLMHIIMCRRSQARALLDAYLSTTKYLRKHTSIAHFPGS